MADQNIYIDGDAGTSGDGSSGSPYNAFSDINWTSGGTNSIADWVTANDNVYINLKGTFHEQLKIQATGTATGTITVQAIDGESPEINGFETVTSGWTLDSGTIYYQAKSLQGLSSYTGERLVVMYGTTVLKWVASIVGLGENEWAYDSGNLYINIGADPDGENILITNLDQGFRCYSKNYITLRDIHVQGPTIPVYFQDSIYCNIIDVSAQYFCHYGLRSLTCNNMTFLRLDFHAELGYDPGGGSGQTANIFVLGGRNNLVQDCKGYNGRRGLDIYQSAGSNDQSGTVISGGEYYNNIWDGPDADGVGVSGTGDADPTVPMVIEDVSAYGNADHGIDCNGGRHVIVRRCLIYDQDHTAGDGGGAGQGVKGGSFLDSSNLFEYNVLYGNSGDGLYDDGSGNQYYHNTSFNNAGYGAHLRFTDGNFIFKNNILANNTDGAVHWRSGDIGTGDIDYNIYYKGTGTQLLTFGTDTDYNDLATYQTDADPYDANTIDSDPDITTAGRLNTSSPAFDAAVALAGYNDVGILDMWDNCPNDTPNIGADQGSDQNVTSIDTGFAFNESSYIVRVKN